MLVPAQVDLTRRGRLNVTMSGPLPPSVVVSIVESIRFAPRVFRPKAPPVIVPLHRAANANGTDADRKIGKGTNDP